MLNAERRLQSNIDSNATSVSTRASSVSLSAATAASVASSKALSVGDTYNASNKVVGSVTASDVALRISTTGDYVINKKFYTKQASSAVFTLAGTTLTASQNCAFMLALDSNGSGIVTQGAIVAKETTPVVPAASTNCAPVAVLVIQNGSASFVANTTTFSQAVAAGASIGISQIARL